MAKTIEAKIEAGYISPRSSILARAWELVREKDVTFSEAQKIAWGEYKIEKPSVHKSDTAKKVAKEAKKKPKNTRRSNILRRAHLLQSKEGISFSEAQKQAWEEDKTNYVIGIRERLKVYKQYWEEAGSHESDLTRAKRDSFTAILNAVDGYDKYELNKTLGKIFKTGKTYYEEIMEALDEIHVWDSDVNGIMQKGDQVISWLEECMGKPSDEEQKKKNQGARDALNKAEEAMNSIQTEDIDLQDFLGDLLQ